MFVVMYCRPYNICYYTVILPGTGRSTRLNNMISYQYIAWRAIPGRWHQLVPYWKSCSKGHHVAFLPVVCRNRNIAHPAYLVPAGTTSRYCRTYDMMTLQTSLPQHDDNDLAALRTSPPHRRFCMTTVAECALVPYQVQVDCYCCLCFYYCPSLIIFLLPHRIFAKWLRHAGNLFLAADRPFRLFVLFLFSLVVFTPELQRPLVCVDCCFCFSHVDDLAYLTIATRWPRGLADLTVASFLHDNCCRTGWLLLFF